MQNCLMKKLLTVFVSGALSSSCLFLPAVATASPNIACEESDALCLKRALLNSVERADTLQLQIEGKDKIIAIVTDQVTLLKDQNQDLAKSADEALQAARAQRRVWYEAPELWFATGTVVGVLLTVAIAAIVVRTIPTASAAH